MKRRLISFKFIMTIAIIEILCYMAVDMYLASMTDIAAFFETPYSKVQLSLTFYLFAMGVGQLFFGPIIDYFGRKIPLILGTSLYALCSFAITTSSNIELFLLYRIIQGLGVALIYICLISMVRDVSKGKVAAKIFAILITIGAITPILAPAIGGYIDQVFGWKAVFYVLFILAILVLILSLFILPETLKDEKKVIINFKNIFIIYFNIIKNMNFLIPAFATCLMYMFIFGYISGASYSYKEIYNLDSKTFGLVFGATGSALLFGALLSTKLLQIVNMKQISIFGAAIIIFGSVVSFISSNISVVGLDGIVIGFFISFFGLGLAEASLFAIAMSSQKTSVGATAALLGSLQLLLPATATLVAGYLVEISIFYWLGLLFILSILAFIFTCKVFRIEKTQF
ncbi:Bcr/CflA family drug resistance efflux transporter [Aliarcobacter trophiarum LMG 25534]|uniref:Bcr/CflA family drug resistance efflux transporter n=1 Tax=Aliarcobacter trophiarum LMG 25534 TaxID=1032241 RepID=A0AAD0QLC8_9BACT|nr:Bcr/CflA family efflux MFS transporter [Aliarcobacter trophiarum]AXK49690.1 drug resistance transporter, Bcr/CflA family [Aliarcobacter trophiarum LMG 25534]RXI25753.1 Bcr/CflA family drug resistance efflux transporter [Aliarcobacter trophiarum]RXJ89594.1 Bcr/CflA family drug resistance efflux transporter [Aliarcobacter trophiarum LMG 25534]